MAFQIIAICLLITIFQLHVATSNPKLTNKYTFNIERIIDCQSFNNKLGPLKFNYVFGVYNRTHKTLTGNATFPTRFDGSFDIGLEIQRWADGGWQKSVMRIKQKNACATFKFYLKPVFETLAEKAGIPAKCPIESGTYNVDNYIIPVFTDIPLFAGRLKLTLDITKSNKRQLCLDIFLIVHEVIHHKS